MNQDIITTPLLAPTPLSMLDHAIRNGASVEVLERLTALYERWEAGEARKEFEEAMALAKGDIKPIFRNRTVDFTGNTGKRTNYDHEDLAEIARSVDPILAKYGLSYRWRTASPPNEPVTVTCIITHRRGHFELTPLSAGRDDSGNKNSIQQIGSTVTFLQRYTLKAAMGLAVSKDTDGRAFGAAAPISDAQVEELQRLILDIGGTKATPLLNGFLKKFKIGALVDLPSSEMKNAIDALNSKRQAGA